MARGELENLYTETLNAKQNLQSYALNAQKSIQLKNELQEKMETLLRAIASADDEAERAKQEYLKLAAQLASIPQDDNDEDGFDAGYSSIRQVILGRMLDAQQRKQQAERRKQQYQEDLEKKKKKHQEIIKELRLLRIRLENLRSMIESLEKRYSSEKELKKEESRKFTQVRGSSKFASVASQGEAIAKSKIKICDQGIKFCVYQKSIATGWINTIDQSLGQQQNRGDGGIDDR